MSPQHPLAAFVKEPEVNTATLHLEWHSVRRRVKRGKQVRTAMIAAAVVFVGVVAGIALRPGPALFTAGQVALTGNTSQTLRLAEGSRVVVAENSEVQLAQVTPSEVTLEVKQGRALFDVEKNPARRFVVKADAVEVRVIGTRFTVQREGTQVSVTVERGIVEVRDGETIRRLERGASWSRSSAPTAALPAQDEPLVDDEADDADVMADAAPTVSPVKNTASPSQRKRAKKKVIAEPRETAERPMITAPVADESLMKNAPAVDQSMKAVEANPADTFAAAMRARADGRAKEAITGFQQVCERWPSSAYAPMSAFEWGRLALDSQGDARQAARAFERTLELATSQSLVEDALARLTEAYARYDVGSCRRVQAEYLRRFPGGPHVRGVTKACPP